jgi:hypothetical protein
MRKHVGALLHVVVADPKEEPVDVHGHQAAYYNLHEAIENRAVFEFALDHRELLYSLAGWLRVRLEMGLLHQFFAKLVSGACVFFGLVRSPRDADRVYSRW